VRVGKGETGLELDICQEAAELLVTPLDGGVFNQSLNQPLNVKFVGKKSKSKVNGV